MTAAVVAAAKDEDVASPAATGRSDASEAGSMTGDPHEWYD